MQLTIYFNGQFWLGVAETHDGSGFKVVRHLFGAEPQDAEVLAFVTHILPALFEQANAQEANAISLPEPEVKNPKRRQREAAKTVRATGIGTQAQLALKQDMEARLRERQLAIQQRHELERDEHYALRRAKAKARHRGR